jgi:hypothetical protein
MGTTTWKTADSSRSCARPTRRFVAPFCSASSLVLYPTSDGIRAAQSSVTDTFQLH